MKNELTRSHHSHHHSCQQCEEEAMAELLAYGLTYYPKSTCLVIGAFIGFLLRK